MPTDVREGGDDERGDEYGRDAARDVEAAAQRLIFSCDGTLHHGLTGTSDLAKPSLLALEQ
jgi:hypothetical protein